jgi:hypothetical protein
VAARCVRTRRTIIDALKRKVLEGDAQAFPPHAVPTARRGDARGQRNPATDVMAVPACPRSGYRFSGRNLRRRLIVPPEIMNSP